MIGAEQPRPWDIATRSQTQADTGLLELADLKARQQAEQLMLERIKQDPALAQQLFSGGSTLGALGPAGGMGAPGGQPPGAITQSPLGGGPAQQIPAYPDASQFATQGAPDQRPRGFAPDGAQPQQSILASLGPAGQPQMQAPQNPLLAMAQQNPRAAMMLQQQMEQRQDVAMKRQEQNMKLGAATLGYVGQQAQGVTDQASLDALRSDLQSQGLGKYAAQLPQLYSKGAMEPFIAKALDVEKSLTLQVQDLAAQAAVIRARKEGRATDVDNQLRGMGVQPGQETPEQMREALRLVQEGKKEVSASHGTGQIVMTPGGAIRVGKDNQVEVIKGPDGQPIYDKPTAAAEGAASYGDRARRAHDNAVALENKGITPTVWSKVGDALPFGLGNYLVGEDQQGYRQAVNQFAGALLRKESGAAISQTEYTMTERTFFPQPGDSKKQIETKRQEREAVIKNLQEEGKGAGRTGTQPPPQGQGAKVVTRAALHAEAARRNVSPEQAEAMARQKGYTVQ